MSKIKSYKKIPKSYLDPFIIIPRLGIIGTRSELLNKNKKAMISKRGILAVVYLWVGGFIFLGALALLYSHLPDWGIKAFLIADLVILTALVYKAFK